MSPWNTFFLHLLKPFACCLGLCWAMNTPFRGKARQHIWNVCAQAQQCKTTWTQASTKWFADLDSVIVCWTHCNVTWMYPENFFYESKHKICHKYYAQKSLMWMWFEDLDWKQWFWENTALKGKHLIVTVVEFSFIWRQDLLYTLPMRQNVIIMPVWQMILWLCIYQQQKKKKPCQWEAQHLMSHDVKTFKGFMF